MKYPTAKEVYDKMLQENDECTSTEMMVAFAKIHVEKAIMKAYSSALVINGEGEKALVFGRSIFNKSTSYSVDKHSIKNAYPLSNIK